MKLVLRTVQDIPVEGIPRHAVVAVDEHGMGKPVAWFFTENDAEEYIKLKGQNETRTD